MFEKFPNAKKFLCKYQIPNFILSKDDEKIELDASNILNVEYMNDYESNIRPLLKVSLRIDVRKKIWILKNKRDVVAKFELDTIGIDENTDGFVTTPEEIWNQEFSLYFSDDNESIDSAILTEDIETEDYFESQNILDVYLFNQSFLDASKNIFNAVFTKSTMQQIVGRVLTATKHKNVLMSPMENSNIYNELLVPAFPSYKALIYLDQYYGFYKKGALIYYDVDKVYILNTAGKISAKVENEWAEVSILVTSLDEATPGNGMLINEDEKMFYISINIDNIGPTNFANILNITSGGKTTVVTTDTTNIEEVSSDMGYIEKQNSLISYIKKDDNIFFGSIMKARMDEANCIIYITAENININAIRPNKLYHLIFDDTDMQELYGKYKFRLAYAYHYIGIESENYMSATSYIVLKKCSDD